MNFLILFTEFLVFLDQNEKNGRRIKIFACNSQMGFGIFWKKKIEPFFCSPGGIAVFVFGIEIGWNFLVTFRFLNVAGLRWAPLVFVGFQIFPLAATFFRIGANAFEIWWRSAILGFGFSVGVSLVVFSNLIDRNFAANFSLSFGLYLIFVSFFHFSEYVTTAFSNPRSLRLDSFLLNHSYQYLIAAIGSWTEFFLELYFFPELKSLWFLTAIGVILCIAGEGFRKGAMITAGTSFTHLISYDKRRDHRLVTRGVYSLFRHPSYVGWFWWSVGTQLILCNPFCTISYAIAAWKFFSDRIEEEELLLINFFGVDYVNYQKRVPTGLPFIPGYSMRNTV